MYVLQHLETTVHSFYTAWMTKEKWKAENEMEFQMDFFLSSESSNVLGFEPLEGNTILISTGNRKKEGIIIWAQHISNSLLANLGFINKNIQGSCELISIWKQDPVSLILKACSTSILCLTLASNMEYFWPGIPI